jgi:hypothetical protein
VRILSRADSEAERIKIHAQTAFDDRNDAVTGANFSG